jgi:hypothetical protein
MRAIVTQAVVWSLIAGTALRWIDPRVRWHVYPLYATVYLSSAWFGYWARGRRNRKPQ